MHDSKLDEIIFYLGDADWRDWEEERRDPLETCIVLRIAVQIFDADQDNPEGRKIQQRNCKYDKKD